MVLLLTLLLSEPALAEPPADSGATEALSTESVDRGVVVIRVVDAKKRDARAWAEWEAQARARLRGLVGDAELPPPPEGDIGAEGIKVVVDGKGLRRHVCKTDAGGRCRIEGVKPGTYRAFIKESGFQADAKLDVQVTAGETEPVVLELREEPQFIIVT